MKLETFVDFKKKVVENVSQVIVGKDEVIELMTIAFISGGHILLEDAPGLGKTMLVRAFAKTINCDFKRVQFTPDLLPSDLTGINFYNQKIEDFQFRQGPIFTNIILADEINRATPRTQSSLLEAMEEKQITVEGVTRKLAEPYMVLATQNPIENYGTFPLPEAQMDRFFMRLSMGYPTREEELQIVERNSSSKTLEDLQSVTNQEEIDYVRNNFHHVTASQEVKNYLMDIVEATRTDNRIQFGISPRGTIALFRGCQVRAAIEGRDYIIPEDVKSMAKYILNHRLTYKGSYRGRDIYELVEMIVNKVDTPLEG